MGGREGFKVWNWFGKRVIFFNIKRRMRYNMNIRVWEFIGYFFFIIIYFCNFFNFGF